MKQSFKVILRYTLCFPEMFAIIIIFIAISCHSITNVSEIVQK